jgi:hypothetical protein
VKNHLKIEETLVLRDQRLSNGQVRKKAEFQYRFSQSKCCAFSALSELKGCESPLSNERDYME